MDTAHCSIIPDGHCPRCPVPRSGVLPGGLDAISMRTYCRGRRPMPDSPSWSYPVCTDKSTHVRAPRGDLGGWRPKRALFTSIEAVRHVAGERQDAESTTGRKFRSDGMLAPDGGQPFTGLGALRRASARTRRQQGSRHAGRASATEPDARMVNRQRRDRARAAAEGSSGEWLSRGFRHRDGLSRPLGRRQPGRRLGRRRIRWRRRAQQPRRYGHHRHATSLERVQVHRDAGPRRQGAGHV